MAANNNCTFIGNLTGDPEGREVGGYRVVSARIAVNGRKKGDAQETLYLDVEAWEKTGEILETYVKKGEKVALSGELKLDEWEDKKTGEKRSKVRLRVSDLHLLGGKKDVEAPAAAAPKAEKGKKAPKPAPAPAPESDEDDDQDIPF